MNSPLRLALLLLPLALCALPTRPAAAGELDTERLKAVVDRHLRASPFYRPGDLLCRGDVEPILNELIDAGLKSSGDIEELYDNFLMDNSHLAQILRTPQGRKFMAGVSSLPGAYDRLERLSWLPEGRTLLTELVASPEGAKVFQTLLEPENLKALEQQLSGDARGKNLRLPTGHVYTAKQLIGHLQKTFASSSRSK